MYLTTIDQNTHQEEIKENDNHSKQQYHIQIVWRNVFIFIYLHTAALYGLYQHITNFSLLTLIWWYLVATGSSQGTGAGVHRLWSHRAYKAKLPLRIYLAFFQTLSLQNHIYEWCRDHRAHHKFVDTDADPHNAARGFFFSHMGWLLCRKHPDVIRKGKTVDLSDLEADPVVMFQKKYYVLLAPLCCFLLPSLVPWYCWNEQWWLSFNFCGVFRYVFTLHLTWLVNSWAHYHGPKPYDKTQRATETFFVSFVTNGEGWHNFHHTFPWDYKAAELDSYTGNWSLLLIDLMAKIGWAYDLKTVSKEVIDRQSAKKGDQSRKVEQQATTRRVMSQG